MYACLLQELALLNKKEVLIWDVWGLMLNDNDDLSHDMNQLRILDDLSDFLKNHAYDIQNLQHYYQNNALLRVPGSVLVCNPFLEPEWVAIDL